MKRIFVIALFLSSALFTPGCENEESTVVSANLPASDLNEGVNGTLLASVTPAQGYEVKFWEINSELMAIESTYPQDASGELVDLIEGATKINSTAELYTRLAGNNINASYLKKIKATEANVNKAVAKFKEQVERGEIVLAQTEEREESPLENARTAAACTTDPSGEASQVCPSGQFAARKCQTNVASFNAQHEFSRDFTVRARCATNGTGVTVSVFRCTRSVCPACPLLPPPGICTPAASKTLKPGDPAYQFTMQGVGIGQAFGNATGNCKLFHMGTGADRR
jgi:hypothetical protein